MKIKLDENLPLALAVLLRQRGHDVKTAAEEGLSGTDDPKIMLAATREERMLVTFDSDFGDIRNYPIGTHPGIVVFRLTDQRWACLKDSAQRLIDSGIIERLRGGLAVVDETRIRIRSGRSDGDEN